MEKIKPSESISSISSLKFQKKTDYKKFLNFIKSETEELEKIGAPREGKIKNILKVGGIGLLGFGLFNLLGKKGEGDKEKIEDKGKSGDFQIPFGIGRQQTDVDFIKGTSGIRPLGETYARQKTDLPFKTPVKQYKKTSKPIKTTVTNPKTKVTTPQKVKVGANVNQGKQGPTGGTGGRPTSGKSKSSLPFEYETFNYSKNKPKVTTPQKVKVPEIFMDIDGKFVDNYDDLSVQGKKANMIRKQLNDPNRKLIKSKRERLIQELDRLEGKVVPTTTVKPNIFQKFMNFYNKGRNVRFPDENKAKLIDLIKDDFSQVTYSDSAFKSGKKGFFNLRPLKAFLDPKMRATGPTPLTRQLIERPFRSLLSAGSSGLKFLKDNPIVKTILKSKVTKTGLIVVDGLFAVQEFIDLFVRPGDNVFTTLYDLYVSVNNAYFQNDPERLKYFITESKGSGRMFGVGATNEQIRRKEIERNLKIKRLKEAAAVEGGGSSGGNNVVIVPFENKKQSAASNSGMIPFMNNTDGNIVIPTSEPLNIGDNILLQKLNQ